MTEFISTDGAVMVSVDVATDLLTIHMPAGDCDMHDKALALIVAAVRIDNDPKFLAMMLNWAKSQGIDFHEMSQH